MKIIYIHGANATSESFTRIREHIKQDDLTIDYDSRNGFDYNLDQMVDKLRDFDDLFFVGHSLGGIYALYLAAKFYSHKTLGGITLSTPYGGCQQADYAKYFVPWSRLMRDIGIISPVMQGVKNLVLPAPWTNIVTTSGTSPWILDPNDGVVTHASMRARADMELIELPLNHYEVVISSRTIKTIQDRINLTNN
jgi:pimeloyl-ACP methyl ester carboxylesterase